MGHSIFAIRKIGKSCFLNHVSSNMSPQHALYNRFNMLIYDIV